MIINWRRHFKLREIMAINLKHFSRHFKPDFMVGPKVIAIMQFNLKTFLLPLKFLKNYLKFCDFLLVYKL